MKKTVAFADLDYGVALLRKTNPGEHELSIYYASLSENGVPQSIEIYGDERIIRLKNLLSSVQPAWSKE